MRIRTPLRLPLLLLPHRRQTPKRSRQPHHPSEPKSIVNVYQLSFGTICGVCAGVFIKKGLKLIAFLLGGCYILLQYLNSQKLVQVNWSAINSKYDNLVGGAAAQLQAAM